jgi:hypothetical protein
MKLEKLLVREAQINPSTSATKNFVFKWSRGDMSAIDHITPDVISDLKATVQDNSFVLYRGWKFSDQAEMFTKLGIKKNLSVGDTFTLSTEKIRSWSKSEHVAEQFANPRYDSINGKIHSDHEIESMGYNHGELLGITVVLKTTVPKSKVMADLENLPPHLIAHGHDELEVIVNAGKLKVEVLSCETHSHKSPHKVDTKLLHTLIMEIVDNFKLGRASFKEMCDKFDNLPTNSEAALLLMVYAFEDESLISEIDEMRVDNGRGLSDDQYERLHNYIKNYHDTGEDPDDLRTEWRHLIKTEVTNHKIDIDWDNFEFEMEPE